MTLDESSTLRTCRYVDRFSIERVEVTGPLAEPVHKSSDVPALLVSLSLRAAAAPAYRLWVDGKVIPMGEIRAFRANVIDLDAKPALWADRGVHNVHYHLRRAIIDEVAADLGYERIGAIRQHVMHEDLVLAQLTKSLLRSLTPEGGLQPLALDQVEQILAAHVVQRYGSVRHRRSVGSSGLAAWQQRCAADLLRANLGGNVRLADLARACDLSVSHFSRSFKASFGVSCHRWVTERRVDYAKQLLDETAASLADVAAQTGFGDQASFTRTFHRFVGMPPGRWRHENSRRSRK